MTWFNTWQSRFWGDISTWNKLSTSVRCTTILLSACFFAVPPRGKSSSTDAMFDVVSDVWENQSQRTDHFKTSNLLITQRDVPVTNGWSGITPSLCSSIISHTFDTITLQCYRCLSLMSDDKRNKQAQLSNQTLFDWSHAHLIIITGWRNTN